MRMILNKGHRIEPAIRTFVYRFSMGTLLFVFVAVILLLNTKQLSAYRLGTFQLIRQWLYAFPLQLHNHTDSDWCLCIGRFSVLSLLLTEVSKSYCTVKSWHE